MKIFYAIATLALLSTSASADGWDTIERCTYSKFFGRMCTTSYREAPSRTIAQEQEDEKARRASIDKWEAFASRRAPTTMKASAAWSTPRRVASSAAASSRSCRVCARWT